MNPGGSPIITADGIPAFVGANTTGPQTVGLVVRVGECDEQLAHHGISHLVEHLLLSTADRAVGSWNGSVDLSTTTFVVHGQSQEIVAFFDRLCATIANPPYERIPVEAKVLQAEAAARVGRGALAAALRHRVGPNGYGLRYFREFCFDQPDPQLVHRWLTEHYTVGNVALWSTGPLPDDLRIRLPPGGSRPLPPVRWADEVYPAFTYEDGPGVVVSLVAEWSVLLQIVVSVAREQLFERLRVQHGLSYEVGMDCEGLAGGALVHLVLWADGLQENAPAVLAHFQAELRRICIEGPDPAVLGRIVASMRKALDEQDADDEVFDAPARARCHLFGVPFEPFAATVEAAERANPKQLAEVLERAMSTAMWLVPSVVEWDDHRTTLIRQWSIDRVRGQAVPILAVEEGEEPQHLVVGDSGVSLLVGDGSRAVTVHFDRTAAMLAYADGDRTLIGDDGFVVAISAARWPDPARLIATLDRSVGAERIVSLPART